MTTPGTIRLHLLRHADAGDPGAWTGPDATRPLSPKGRRQAERLGAHLVAVEFATDVILSSSRLRARETAEIVGDLLGQAVRIEDGLASGFGLEELDAMLAAAGRPARPVLVGHDPDFSEVASIMAGAEIALKKGALARIDVDGALVAGAGRLRWLLPPDLVPAR